MHDEGWEACAGVPVCESGRYGASAAKQAGRSAVVASAAAPSTAEAEWKRLVGAGDAAIIVNKYRINRSCKYKHWLI